jgi:hypothetical protein
MDATLLLLDQFFDLAMLLVTQELVLHRHLRPIPKRKGLPIREPLPIPFVATTA